jgi:hypothetical protein
MPSSGLMSGAVPTGLTTPDSGGQGQCLSASRLVNPE